MFIWSAALAQVSSTTCSTPSTSIIARLAAVLTSGLPAPAAAVVDLAPGDSCMGLWRERPTLQGEPGDSAPASCVATHERCEASTSGDAALCGSSKLSSCACMSSAMSALPSGPGSGVDELQESLLLFEERLGKTCSPASAAKMIGGEGRSAGAPLSRCFWRPRFDLQPRQAVGVMCSHRCG